MWLEILTPPTPSPIRAYTHTNASVLFICTASGVFALSLIGSPTWHFVSESIRDYMLFGDELVRYDEYGAIVFRETYSALHGYPTEGSVGCSDISLGEHPLTHDRLNYDHATDTLTIFDASGAGGAKLTVHPFGASPYNWATAGFSEDGKHLTVGNLNRILVFRYSSDTEGIA